MSTIVLLGTLTFLAFRCCNASAFGEPKDCADLLDRQILVFQRRVDGSVEFERTWKEYADGFGDLRDEFWLGNHYLYHLTEEKTSELRIDMADFKNEQRYAKYDSFKVSGPAYKYKLNIGAYSGDAGDSLAYHNGMEFTTKDEDNDMYHNNCAQMYKGAWWYNACHHSNLNGKYLGGNHVTYADGVDWLGWLGHHYSLKTTEMKLRPAGYQVGK